MFLPDTDATLTVVTVPRWHHKIVTKKLNDIIDGDTSTCFRMIDRPPGHVTPENFLLRTTHLDMANVTVTVSRCGIATAIRILPYHYAMQVVCNEIEA